MKQYYWVVRPIVIGLTSYLSQADAITELLSQGHSRIVAVRNGKPVGVHYCQQDQVWETCPLCGCIVGDDARYGGHGRRCSKRIQPLSATNGWRQGRQLSQNDLFWLKRQHYRFAAISQEPDPDYNPDNAPSNDAILLDKGVWTVDDLVDREYKGF